MKRPHTYLAMSFVLAVLVLGFAGTSKVTGASSPPATQADSEYAGSETCVICHARNWSSCFAPDIRV